MNLGWRAAWRTAVPLLTLGWILGVAILLWQAFGVDMEQWASGYSDDGGIRREQLARKGAWLLLWLAVVVAGAPLLIAAVAAAGRLVRTAIVYGILAFLLAVPAGLLVRGSLRTLDPPPPPVPPSRLGHCVEHSGGDTRCPGG